MSQTYTANCFQSSHIGQTDLQNMENNFAALLSAFLGTSAPANPVGGMRWVDSTNHFFKIRNEANDAWLAIYDLANQRVLASLDSVNCSRNIIAGTGLSGGGVLSADRTLTHASHTGDVTGATVLTIGNDKVYPSKCYPGTLMVASGYAEKTCYGTDKDTCFFKVKCPSGPTSLRFWVRAKEGVVAAQLRATVPGIGTGSYIGITTSFVWYDLGAIDMSAATPGTMYDVIVQINGAGSTHPATIEGVSIWWE